MHNVTQEMISLCSQANEHTLALGNNNGTGPMACYVPIFLPSVTFHFVLDRVNAQVYFERTNVVVHKAKTMKQE
jgi:hypothetical protein